MVKQLHLWRSVSSRTRLLIVALLLPAAVCAFAGGCSAGSSPCRPPGSGAPGSGVPGSGAPGSGAPDVLPSSPLPALRFFAVGDTGRGDAGQAAVAQAMSRFQAEFGAELVLLLGDNFYPRGVRSTADPQWQSKFESMYDPAALDVPFYAVLGNHDYRRNELAQIEYSRMNPGSRWKMPGRYYAVQRRLPDGAGVEFFALDTNTAAEDQAQLRWLDRALASSTADWKIVFAHHVLYSNGHYGDDRRLLAVLEPRLIRGGADLYLSGHEHDLQILEPASGVSYMISGAGARTRRSGCGDNTVYAAASPGFLAFEISRTRVVVYVVLAGGGVDFIYMLRGPEA